MGYPRSRREYRILGVVVVGFSMVHLSLLPGPSAAIEPAWITDWSLHLGVYTLVAGALLLDSLRHRSAPRETVLATLLPGVLVLFLVAILIGAIPLSLVGVDVVSMTVPGLLAGAWILRERLEPW